MTFECSPNINNSSNPPVGVVYILYSQDWNCNNLIKFEQEIKHLSKFQYISLIVQVMQIQSHFSKRPDLISNYRSRIMEIGFVPV